LNNLAWILATTGSMELRNGGEAVALAARAVELSEHAEPTFLRTLSAACAADGQFPRAIATARTAHDLAWLTGQTDLAAQMTTLMSLYSSGKAVVATAAP
jgi:hypothetical protein